jgi:hypothetical protein
MQTHLCCAVYGVLIPVCIHLRLPRDEFVSLLLEYNTKMNRVCFSKRGTQPDTGVAALLFLRRVFEIRFLSL